MAKIKDDLHSKVPPTKRIFRSFTYGDFQEAIKMSDGYMTGVANALGISSFLVEQVFLKYKGLKRDFLEFKEGRLDCAERKLMEKIFEGKGDTTALLFYLKTIGKDRGYIERVDDKPKKSRIRVKIVPAKEVEGKDGKKITVIAGGRSVGEDS